MLKHLLTFILFLGVCCPLQAQQCNPPVGPIVQNIYPPICYNIGAGDTVEECFSFTAPGNFLLFASLPPWNCTTLVVRAKLYDASCNLIQANAFGLVIAVPGQQYIWCIRIICHGTHDSIYCPVYQDLSALPVELLYFTAHYNQSDNRVLLEWATASETNNDYFRIDAAKQDTAFYGVAKVQGAGNSSFTNYYKAEDPVAAAYYRIAAVDYDGNTSYSNIVKVVKKKKEKHQVVYDITGRELKNFTEKGFYILIQDGQPIKIVK